MPRGLRSSRGLRGSRSSDSMFEFELEIMEREGASDNVSLISSSGVGHADVELPTWIDGRGSGVSMSVLRVFRAPIALAGAPRPKKRPLTRNSHEWRLRFV